MFTVIVVGLLGYTFAVGNKPLLGLDLKGGISATLQPRDPKVPSSSVEQAKQIIRNRIDALGVAEPDIVRQGKTVVVSLPGVKDPARAKEVIGRTAKMEFRAVMRQEWQIVNPLNASAVKQSKQKKPATPSSTPQPSPTTPSTAGQPGATTPTPAPGGGQGRSVTFGAQTPPTTPPGGNGQSPPTTTAPTPPTSAPAPSTSSPASAALKAAQGYGNPEVPRLVDACLKSPTTPPDLQVGKGEVVLPDQVTKKEPVISCYLLGPVDLQGKALSKSEPQLDPQSGQWNVGVSVKGSYEGKANKFMNACYEGNSDPAKGPVCPVTGQGDTGPRGRMAIVLDGQVLSAPTVDAINLASNTNGFQIQGNFTQSSAKELSLQLRYGALPVVFKEATFQKVSATLGANSLHAGLVSGLIGLALVAIYMIVFYRLLGLVAIASLAAASGLLWVVIAYLGAHNGLALTLAGITGIIVSVGVAVDSNVVCFEHFREDVDKGRSLRSTADRSWKDAWRVIVSADVVSLIGAAILYYFTVGSVRGFAFYLGLSTILDLVASWFLMRPAVMLLARSSYFQTRPRMLGITHRRAPEPAAPAGNVAGAET